MMANDRETTAARERKASEAAWESREDVSRAAEKAEAEAVAEAAEQMAEAATSAVRAMLQTSALLANGHQKIWREWLACSRDAMQKNVDGLTTLMRARTFEEAFTAQAELMRCEIETLLSSSVKLSELSAAVANDAVHKMSEYAASRAG
jgi:hypothetical protein